MASPAPNVDQLHFDENEDDSRSSMGDPPRRFVYDALNHSSPTIRLLSLPIRTGDEMIECQLRTFQLDQAPEYEALSYTWGSQVQTNTIKLNGLLFSVTHNLYVALQHLTRTDNLTSAEESEHPLERCIWIDALCINQDCIPERDHQVSLMWSIYSKAARVLVWLGPEHDDSFSAMEMVRLLSLWAEMNLRKMTEKIEGHVNRKQQAEPEESDSSRVVQEVVEEKADSPVERTLTLWWIPGDYHIPRSLSGSDTSHATMSSRKDVAGTQGGSEDEGVGEREADEAEEISITDEETLSHIPFHMLLQDLSFKGRTNQYGPLMWVALQKLLARPWWRRVWVVQEIAAATGPIAVGCGTYWMDWEAFERAAHTITEYQTNPNLQRMAHLGAGAKYIRDKASMRRRADGRLDNWNGLMQLLASTESYLASDPRDRVFALLGFLPSTGFLPDYNSTVEQVYEAVVKRSIHFGGNLSILNLNREPKRLQIPSWMPDFSLDLPTNAYNFTCPMGFFGADGNKWIDLGVRSFSCALVEDEPGQLTVHGFVYDTPKLLGRVWDGPAKDLLTNIFPIIEEYQEMMHSADAEHFPDMPGQQREESFWRTLIWNSNNDDRYPAPQEYGKAFRHFTKHRAYTILYNTGAFEVDEDRLEFRGVPKGDAWRYYERLLRYSLRRRFFITSKGHLGSGPASMDKDDEVCILFGAKTPVILRKEPSREQYRLIGHAYVHGVMHGEALSSMKYKTGANGTREMSPDSFVLI